MMRRREWIRLGTGRPPDGASAFPPPGSVPGAGADRPLSGDGGEHRGDSPDAALALRIRRYLADRAARSDLWPGALFRDPAWEVALDLLASGLEHRVVTVTDACVASGVPKTTALGAIERMVEVGMICRTAHPRDRRSCHLALVPEFARRLRGWVLASLSDEGACAGGVAAARP